MDVMCVYQWGSMYECVEKSEDHVQVLTLSFHHAGPRHQTEIITLGGRNLYLSSQLPAPHSPSCSLMLSCWFSSEP